MRPISRHFNVPRTQLNHSINLSVQRNEEWILMINAWIKQMIRRATASQYAFSIIWWIFFRQDVLALALLSLGHRFIGRNVLQIFLYCHGVKLVLNPTVESFAFLYRNQFPDQWWWTCWSPYNGAPGKYGLSDETSYPCKNGLAGSPGHTGTDVVSWVLSQFLV